MARYNELTDDERERTIYIISFYDNRRNRIQHREGTKTALERCASVNRKIDEAIMRVLPGEPEDVRHQLIRDIGEERGYLCSHSRYYFGSTAYYRWKKKCIYYIAMSLGIKRTRYRNG